MLFRPPAVAAVGFGLLLLWPVVDDGRTRFAGGLLESTHAQSDEHGLWIVPPSNAPGRDSALALAVAQIPKGRTEAAAALPQLLRAANQPLVGGYALLYAGRAQLVMGQPDAAAATASRLRALKPGGYLAEAALWLAIEAAEQAHDWKDAIAALEDLQALKPMDPARVSLRIGRAHKELGNRREALAALRRAYYEYPLTAEAAEAGREILGLATSPRLPTAEFFELDLGRAQRLFGAGRYAEAKAAYEFIKPRASGAAAAN